MSRRQNEKIPMNPELRAQVLGVIEVYREKKLNVEGPYAELVPAMMKTVSDLIAAYDKNELNLTLQRKLIQTMKKLASKYRV